MSRLLHGDEGFKYAYRHVRKDLPIEKLAQVSGAGALRLVVDHFVVGFESEKAQDKLVFLEDLRKRLRLPDHDDRGLYEADDPATTPRDLFERLKEEERAVDVPALRELFAKRKPAWIDVVANVQYRLEKDEGWEAMLAYLNSLLPEEAPVTEEELRRFRSALLAEFDPEKHEPNREDGTGFLMYFLESGEDECLPYLALRILVHAMEHDLETFDVDDEPRWRTTLWTSDEEQEPPAEKPPAAAEKPAAAKRPAAAEKPAAAEEPAAAKEPAAKKTPAAKKPPAAKKTPAAKK